MENSPPKRLTDLLIDKGLIDQAGLQRAIGLVQQSGRRLLCVLAESKMVDEARLVRVLSQALGLETVELSSIQINERVISRLPAMLAQTLGVLPLAAKRANGQEYLYVAMADPLDARAVAEIQKATSCRLSVLVASPTQLEARLMRHYGSKKSSSAPPPALEKSQEQAPVMPAIMGKPVTPLGIENFRSDIVDTHIEPEISDIIITPARDGPSSPGAVDEQQITTDHGIKLEASTEDASVPSKLLESMSQSWDDGETLDFDVDEFHGRQVSPAAKNPSAQIASALAMEVPLPVEETSSPFDGMVDINLPPGLERTGIIPIGEFQRAEFEPPPVEEESKPDYSSVIGLGDIPQSEEEVRARGLVPADSNRGEVESVPESVETAQALQGIVDEAEIEVAALPLSEASALELAVQEPNRELKSQDAEPENVLLDAPGSEAYEAANPQLRSLVQDLRSGRSLNSAQRAQLVLAVTRIMLDKGLMSEKELIDSLAAEDASK